MSEDDDFDKFLEEIENDETLKAIPECPSADDTFDDEDETEKFLKELEDTKDLRAEMHNDPGPVASTPKLIDKLKLRNQHKYKSEDLSTDDAESPSISSVAKKIKVDNNDKDDEKDSIVDKVNKMLEDVKANKSAILAGNLSTFKDDEYDFLLYGDNDDDNFDDGYAQELTIDELLQMEELLESSDEELEEEEEELNTTVIKASDKDADKTLKSETEKKKKETSTLKPVKQAEVKAQKKESIDIKALKNIKYEYYNELSRVYKIYLDDSPPPIASVREPRIFKDKSHKVIGYEGLDEYLDNNHPLWTEDRMKFGEFLRNRYDGPEKLAEYINKKWKSGLHIDLCQNLSCIPKIKYVERDQNCVYIMPVQEEQDLVEQGYKDNIAALMEMNETVKNNKTVDQEQIRLKELTGTESKDDDDCVDEVKRESCKYCEYFCTCGSQKTIEDSEASRKRKRTGSGGGDESKKPFKRKLNRDDMVKMVYNQNKRRKVDEIARIVKSAEDALDFNQCFTLSRTFSRQMLQELISLEDVYQGFEYYYSSPYGQSNKAKSKFKSGDSAKKASKAVKDKQATADSKKGSEEGNYQKFIEDY